MRLGELLKYYRFKHDLTSRQLGKILNISASTLVRIENGHDCDSKTLMAIFNWLTVILIVLGILFGGLCVIGFFCYLAFKYATTR